MGFLDYLASSAVSLTVSGNTGISPFLTLLLLGVVEKSDPELLNMDGFIENVLSSWIGIGVLGVLTGLEFLGKCIPVVDEMVDSVEIFVVPVLSIFGSMGTLGLLDLIQETTGERRLDVGDSMLIFLKLVLVVIGVFLALSIHLFKMLIRMIGITCCAGCCQPCITIVELVCVLVGVLVSIFIQEIAIGTCIILFLAAGYAIKRKFIDKNMPESNGGGNGATPSQTPNATNESAPVEQSTSNNDVETGQTNLTKPAKLASEDAPRPNAPPSINPEYITVEVEGGDSTDNIIEVEAVPIR